MKVRVDVSLGELFDKMTILQLKTERIHDEGLLVHAREELRRLRESMNSCLIVDEDADNLYVELLGINEELWVVEDKLRDHEQKGDFGPDFVTHARQVYALNDMRSDVKRQINEKYGSELVEVKSYGTPREEG